MGSDHKSEEDNDTTNAGATLAALVANGSGGEALGVSSSSVKPRGQFSFLALEPNPYG